MGIKDITGQRSGRLVAIRFFHIVNECSFWLCKCDCGNEKVIRLSSFKRPNLSCGCLHKEIQRKRLTKHGMSRTPEYHAWQALHQRCYTKRHPEYHRYGARGITVCKRWSGSGGFVNFLADVGLRPSAQHSIERRNNNNGYSPDNCYWGTIDDQNRNKRNNHLITWNGKSQILNDWARELRINPKTLSERLRDGWTIERALTAPVVQRRSAIGRRHHT